MIVPDFVIKFGGGKTHVVEFYWMNPAAAMWRGFILWLNPHCRRPWRLWHWTGLCRAWEREAWRRPFAEFEVSEEWAFSYFPWPIREVGGGDE